MKLIRVAFFLLAIPLCSRLAPAAPLRLEFSGSRWPGGFALAAGQTLAPIVAETNNERAVLRAAADLAADFNRVTGQNPGVRNDLPAAGKDCVIIGTIGRGGIIDRLVADKKLDVAGVSGQWESYVLQIVKNPQPGVKRALVIAGSDRRGAIYGIYQLSEMMGVSPWYWWADVPVKPQKCIIVRGDELKQGPPAVKYRGIFLNDEDWCLRPWASKTFDSETGNIGPKTYAKVFELLLRLRANYLWPAMHPGTAAFNSFPEDRELADEYGVVMGSSHCEQMLRNNVSEWNERTDGDYNFETNPDGVLKYWGERLRENGRYENIYTMGMRGIHDSGMPGGGSEIEKAARLQTIVADQRKLLAHLVDTNVAGVPQLFCPYKEVLGLYRLMTNLPEDITLVWPDDNYGYVRQYSNASERRRSGGAGVYYHVSYWGGPRDYLWLCSTPPALMAEEMTKAFDFGADRIWIVNVGDLKPAELDIEYFLKLGWNPRAWNGANTYDLLRAQFARDFGAVAAPELTSIMAEYYRLNFQRKPEHVDFPNNHLFSAAETQRRLADWRRLAGRVDAMAARQPPELRDAFFELVEYPVKSAAAMNEKCLAGSQAAEDEIHRLTDVYNNQIAGGKWRLMMSDNPRKQVDRGVPPPPFAPDASSAAAGRESAPARMAGADFAEQDHRIVMAAARASAFKPGRDAHWQRIAGLGYDGEAVSITPVTVGVRVTPEKILAESPCLLFRIGVRNPGDWRFVVRALPTFSVDTSKPQRYAIAIDGEAPRIISLPVTLDERNPVWQENVLRNAAYTASVHAIRSAGAHTLRIWMVDPGIVIDAIAAVTGDQAPGYDWPAETGAAAVR